MVKTGASKPRNDSLNPHTRATLRVRRAPNELAASPRWTSQVPPTEEGTTQMAGSPHSSGSHSSRPEWSQAEWPRATAPAPSPNEDVAPGSTTLLPYPMPGGHTSQDRPPATDVVSGGPSAVLAAALNDRLNRIAQRFDWLEHRQCKVHNSIAVYAAMVSVLDSF